MPRPEALETLLAQLIEEFAATQMAMRQATVSVAVADDAATVRFACPGWQRDADLDAQGRRAFLHRALAHLLAHFSADLARIVSTCCGIPVAEVRTAVGDGAAVQTYAFSRAGRRAPQRARTA